MHSDVIHIVFIKFFFILSVLLSSDHITGDFSLASRIRGNFEVLHVNSLEEMAGFDSSCFPLHSKLRRTIPSVVTFIQM